MCLVKCGVVWMAKVWCGVQLLGDTRWRSSGFA